MHQADLSEAGLSGADPRYADLYEADLTNANLTGERLEFATMPNGSTYNQGYVQPPSNLPKAATTTLLKTSLINQKPKATYPTDALSDQRRLKPPPTVLCPTPKPVFTRMTLEP